MLLEILHETVYDYDFPVDITQHLAHLKPSHTAGQEVLKAQLLISPEPDYREEKIDTFGNINTFFSIENRHQRLKTVANSLIKTIPSAPGSIDSLSNSPAWEIVRQYHRYEAHQVIGNSAHFIFPSPMISYDPSFVKFAQECFSPGKPILLAVKKLMEKIYHEMNYETASTQVNSLAVDSLRNRKGVCQDFAHIMISCLRMLGLPAKYISGYMLSNPPPGRPRLIGSDASHAWVAVYVPKQDENSLSGWFHFDPTNNHCGQHAPGEEYVILSEGRDYADVSPIRGVIYGGGNHRLSVAVTVLPVQEN